MQHGTLAEIRMNALCPESVVVNAHAACEIPHLACRDGDLALFQCLSPCSPELVFPEPAVSLQCSCERLFLQVPDRDGKMGCLETLSGSYNRHKATLQPRRIVAFCNRRLLDLTRNLPPFGFW